MRTVLLLDIILITLTIAVLFGGHTDDLPEFTGKVGNAVEAGAFSNIHHEHIGIIKQLPCSVYSAGDNIADDSGTEVFAVEVLST